MYLTLIFVGNVGRDPELRYAPSGTAVCSFSVATSNKYTSSTGEKIEETTWLRVSTWGKHAEICNQYLKKGSKVLVEGRLTPDKATGGPKVFTKQDGTASAAYEVNASVVRFLSPSQQQAESATMDDSQSPF